MPDLHANFAASTVAVAPSPATSGVTATLQTGDGALFPSPPFDAVVCPATSPPTNANAEIVRVTAIASDVVTFTRGPQTGDPGGINRTIVTGDQFFSAITRKTLTDMEQGGAAYGTFQAHAPSAVALTAAWAKVALTVGTGDFDLSGWFSNANSRFQPKVAGYYQINGGLGSNSTATAGGYYACAIYKTGVQQPEGVQFLPGATGCFGAVTASALVFLNGSTDYVELWGIESGQTITFTGWLQGALVSSTGSPSPGQGLATMARAYRSTAFTTVAASGKIPIDHVDVGNDPGNNFDLVNHRYVCPVTGWYQVNGNVTSGGTTSGSMQIILFKNGSTTTAGTASAAGVAGLGADVSDTVFCQAGDYLELWVWSAAAYALSVGSSVNFMSVVQVGGTNLIGALSPTAQSAAYTAGPGQCVLMTGVNPVTLPSAPMAGSYVQVVALTGTVAIGRGGTDTITIPNGSSGNTSISLGAGSNVTLQYLSGVWYQIDGSQPILPSPWIAATLTGPWANVAGSPVSYMKDPTGYVHLRGLIGTLNTSGSVALTLPTGYRPGADDWYPISAYVSGTTPGSGLARIPSTGGVTVYYSSGATELGFGNISFLAEN